MELYIYWEILQCLINMSTLLLTIADVKENAVVSVTG